MWNRSTVFVYIDDDVRQHFQHVVTHYYVGHYCVNRQQLVAGCLSSSRIRIVRPVSPQTHKITMISMRPISEYGNVCVCDSLLFNFTFRGPPRCAPTRLEFGSIQLII